MKVDLSQSVRQIRLWGSSAVQHPELFKVMLGQRQENPEQIEMYVGPPGTGKTRTMTERMLENLYSGSSFVGVHTSWTNVATQNCYHSVVALGEEKGFDMEWLRSRLVVICSTDADKLKFQGLGAKTVTLAGKDLSVWEDLVAQTQKEPLVFFLTVGKLMNEERHYRTPLDALACSVDFLHADEAAQILNWNGKHMLRVLKPKTGKLALTGDTAQLPAFSFSKWQIHVLMRYLAVSIPQKLLCEQYRQVQGLSAFSSEMFYEGRVKNANTVLKPYQPNILLVTWTHDGSQPDGFPAPFEAALAAELFRSLQFDPKEDSIITFYGAQRKAISSALRDNRVCRIVDSSQGSVVEGFPDPAVFLFI